MLDANHWEFSPSFRFLEGRFNSGGRFREVLKSDRVAIPEIRLNEAGELITTERYREYEAARTGLLRVHPAMAFEEMKGIGYSSLLRNLTRTWIQITGYVPEGLAGHGIERYRFDRGEYTSLLDEFASTRHAYVELEP